MTHEQEALWQRIRDHRIDAPNASLPYSARLARERGWTPVYAARVVEEYRRFAFLAVASGHGATPSKAVDEAWHLHLLYTRDYWEEFCPKALGRPLHHHPADGGTEDDAKYEGWYRDTLASYERLFGESPPEDVWPRTDAPRRQGRLRLAWLALLPFVLTGCDEPLNPLGWHGPPFLGLIAGLYIAFLGAGLLLREALRTPVDGPPAGDWRLHVDEEAFLNEGSRLALTTALARLTAAGSLDVDRKRGRIRALEGGQGDHPLDRAILRAASRTEGADYETIHRAAGPTLDAMEASLRRQGLWMPHGEAANASLLPGLIATLPVLLGGMKILVGLDRGRPVGFLVIGCLVALVLNAFLFLPPKRSRYGDRVLEELRLQKGDARWLGNHADLPPDRLATGVALYGHTVLADSPYAYLTPIVQPVPMGGGDGGGGSSCGGGGGGCGGGGCGGCGS